MLTERQADLLRRIIVEFIFGYRPDGAARRIVQSLLRKGFVVCGDGVSVHDTAAGRAALAAFDAARKEGTIPTPPHDRGTARRVNTRHECGGIRVDAEHVFT